MSNPDSKKPVQKFLSPLQKAVLGQNEEFKARLDQLAKQYGIETPGGDKQLDKNQQHNYAGDEAAKKKNFDEKIYMFPESFNALRREMEGYWPTLFNQVPPGLETSIAYDMVFDAPQFVARMNGALDLQLQADSENVDGICKAYLNALRKLRGISSIN